jgi:hypothetical protein
MTDRASAEGLRALADRWEAEGQRRDADPTRHHDPVNVLAAGIYHEHAEALLAAIRDTGPRPDSGIDDHEHDHDCQSGNGKTHRHEYRHTHPVEHLHRHEHPTDEQVARRIALSTPRTETSDD